MSVRRATVSTSSIATNVRGGFAPHGSLRLAEQQRRRYTELEKTAEREPCVGCLHRQISMLAPQLGTVKARDFGLMPGWEPAPQRRAEQGRHNLARQVQAELEPGRDGRTTRTLSTWAPLRITVFARCGSPRCEQRRHLDADRRRYPRPASIADGGPNRPCCRHGGTGGLTIAGRMTPGRLLMFTFVIDAGSVLTNPSRPNVSSDRPRLRGAGEGTLRHGPANLAPPRYSPRRAFAVRAPVRGGGDRNVLRLWCWHDRSDGGYLPWRGSGPRADCQRTRQRARMR